MGKRFGSQLVGPAEHPVGRFQLSQALQKTRQCLSRMSCALCRYYTRFLVSFYSMCDRSNFADTVFRSRFPFADNTFWQKKREAKKLLPWVLFLWLQSYRLLDGNDQAAVSCLSADHGYELVVAVAEGQTVYSLFFVYVNQDLIPDLLNKRALDV